MTKLKPSIRKIAVIIGAVLVVLGLLLFVGFEINIETAIKQNAKDLISIKTLLPKEQGAVLEEKSDNNMPILSVNETDFIGILRMPKYQLELPVCAHFGAIYNHPCLFDGSIYDRTIQIGGSSQKGQFDFYREISIGDNLTFTDALGNSYTYAVTNLYYEKNASPTTITKKNADLTLFIKNIYAFEYLIVCCDVLS